MLQTKVSARAGWRLLVCGTIVVFSMLGSAPDTRAAETATGAQQVGTTVAVRRRLTGTIGTSKRRLRKGARVHLDETLETSRKGRAEFRLDDETKLALGPRARLKLDNFAVGGSDGIATVTLNFITGTFRFITGSRKSESYRIETPSATIGIRGTVFDVYVDRRGDTLVLLHEGEVEICSRTRRCTRHTSVGQIIHATLAGALSLPLKFTRALIPGVTVGRAFPFVGRRLLVDPVRRLRRADIIDKAVTRPVRRTGRAIQRGTRDVGRSIRKLSPF